MLTRDLSFIPPIKDNSPFAGPCFVLHPSVERQYAVSRSVFHPPAGKKYQFIL
ncbi:hypothetical protein AB434_3892 [Heyndrickxia coagulans]|nr:hypothetical protein AB434_3892 [Heyndrickxia coagulans]